ncbi:hypothetical protein DMC47_19280 [Nostoc sp. 3335mG]|nr:hypothetical protein DMC47_19280 [Nostoc sp. 3335mG]
MKEELCQAFCAQLHVEKLLSGWAVRTPYRLPDGDPVMFFIMTQGDNARLEDDGATVGLLEAAGVSLDKRGARYQAFSALLDQHGATYDEAEGVIRTDPLPLADVAAASVSFTALMLRVHDLALLTVERVRQSWQDDAMRDLHSRFDPIARVEENVPVHPHVGALPADAVIRLPNEPPIAIIMGTTNAKGLQALVLKMELEKYQGQDIPVILLVERAKDNPLAEGTYALAQSRLNGVHTYRGAEAEAISAISRLVPGTLQ